MSESDLKKKVFGSSVPQPSFNPPFYRTILTGHRISPLKGFSLTLTALHIPQLEEARAIPFVSPDIRAKTTDCIL
jgi:hypothetical protein